MRKQLHRICERIERASLKCPQNKRPVSVVAVTKTIKLNSIEQALNGGITAIGENYIQEAKLKYKLLSKRKITWHFIGHLQTNKVKYAVKMFDLIHTVDSIKLAEVINDASKKIDKIQNVLIQINMDKEKTRSGINEDNLLSLVKKLSQMQNVIVSGLMVIPPASDTSEHSRPYFSRLAFLRKEISRLKLARIPMNELSMGMSKDFEIAIEEGASIVRIGTAIFGARN